MLMVNASANFFKSEIEGNFNPLSNDFSSSIEIYEFLDNSSKVKFEIFLW